ncbi:VOC family protein [Nocardioides daphniae]|uniref:Glyoxalase n=2 Tax=Nocardioides daphniae TaxID=402297 RepID=A0A4P7UHM4_9ACTN|nr:VOC family protein [Nocardioides daphniae]QCC78735.1 VOC family protein [Nocardioides daphniae]GGD31058.1 glyoxalase [Nocardioides daphniae]
MSLVVHFEIHASEPQRLIDFYSDVFGWSFSRFGDSPYWVIDTGERSIRNEGEPGFGINGGLVQREGPAPEPGAPVAGANLVVGTDDVDALHAKALAAGATEAMGLTDMEGVGRLGYVIDPDGNMIGMIAPTM